MGTDERKAYKGAPKYHEVHMFEGPHIERRETMNELPVARSEYLRVMSWQTPEAQAGNDNERRTLRVRSILILALGFSNQVLNSQIRERFSLPLQPPQKGAISSGGGRSGD